MFLLSFAYTIYVWLEAKFKSNEMRPASNCPLASVACVKPVQYILIKMR
jgi:hypothetical protein